MNIEKLLRKVDGVFTQRPAKWLAGKGVRANAVSAVSLFSGVTGEYMALRNHETAAFIKEKTGGIIDLSPTVIQWAGVILVLKSFYEDILDGAVADEQEGGPTETGGILDHSLDRIVDSMVDAIEMGNINPWRRLAATLNLNLIARPSELRAIAKKHGIYVPEIDFGSRLPRFFSLMGVLISEEHRIAFININSVQSLSSIGLRYFLIHRSGNEEAITDARDALFNGTALFALTRLDRPTSWWRNTFSQAVAIVPSINAKVNSNNHKQ